MFLLDYHRILTQCTVCKLTIKREAQTSKGELQKELSLWIQIRTWATFPRIRAENALA